jgi:cytochrome c oxidase cbb3-type subunit 1
MDEDQLMGGVVPLFVTLGVLTVVALLATAFTDDSAMRFHGTILLAAGILALAALIIGVNNGRFRADPDRYSDGVIRAGVIATMFWGVVGMAVGVLIASQLSWPNIFYFPDHGWLNFGRLRPLHTSGVIFAFGGNALICTSFWVVQRTSRARLAGGIWPWFVFWGYQLFIVLAATGYLAGIT